MILSHPTSTLRVLIVVVLMAIKLLVLMVIKLLEQRILPLPILVFVLQRYVLSSTILLMLQDNV